jgi:hydrogenase maturation protein HypF
MQKRLLIEVSGIVQGVGFRPFIYRLAKRLKLSGFVRNNARGVNIEIQGRADDTQQFLHILQNQPPPLAVITDIQSSEIKAGHQDSFQIISSDTNADKQALISPDIATCADCIDEMFDPGDRRYQYPFINCTNCGPRFTIIEDIPYDRPSTSMAEFRMCDNCQREYDDPGDRRFHAQPNACNICGPQISFLDHDGKEQKVDPLIQTLQLLADGKIVAIKGIGGFHLAVDATNDAAVKRLRNRKRRFEKPLALMVADITTAREIAHIDEFTEKLLLTLQRPIVLCRRKDRTAISKAVSLDNDDFGIMLPYTPLHELLFRESDPKYLVMTSANISEEPICHSNEECRERMNSIADAYLVHNRDILTRCDDSVMRIWRDKPFFLRRSRGYTPRPIILNRSGRSVLAVGGHKKNTICLTRKNLAFLSQHIGDLENLATLTVFEHSIEYLKRLLEIDYELLVHDLHPDYLSTRWSMENAAVPLFGLQHHYAHILSVMAEQNLESDIIGFSMDGTGYGSDGKVWGGEVLLCNIHNFQRLAHFEYIPMPGAELAIRQPWRMAYAYIKAHSEDHVNLIFKHFPELQSKEQILAQMIQKQINSPLTSSLGRLFDAVAGLLGIKSAVAYEGQAAIILESYARRHGKNTVPDIDSFIIEEKDSTVCISARQVIKRLAGAMSNGESPYALSAAFHYALIEVFTSLAILFRGQAGIEDIALSGGCFQNTLLLSGLEMSLRQNGFQVYTNRQVPVNDGGICLGQAYWGMYNNEIS